MFQRIPKPALGCGAILLLMFGCVLASFVFFDRTCYGYLSRRLPIYPGAEIVSRQHNFVSEWGVGNTVMTLYTPDAPEVVQAWYARESGGYLRQAIQSGDWGYRMAQGDWAVAPDARGTGSQVILFGTCVQ
jgi:hypothetical protein